MPDTNKQESQWGLPDILQAPSRKEAKPVTKEFEALGSKWPITISPDALDDANAFYDFAAKTQSYVLEGHTVTVQDPVSGEFTLTSGIYIAGLELLSKIAAPKLSLDEWAIFGKKVGATKMEEILAWVSTTAKLTGAHAKAEFESAKKDTRKGRSQPRSTKPVLPC